MTPSITVISDILPTDNGSNQLMWTIDTGEHFDAFNCPEPVATTHEMSFAAAYSLRHDIQTEHRIVALRGLWSDARYSLRVRPGENVADVVSKKLLHWYEEAAMAG